MQQMQSKILCVVLRGRGRIRGKEETKKREREGERKKERDRKGEGRGGEDREKEGSGGKMEGKGREHKPEHN